jgi:hypothetical protein
VQSHGTCCSTLTEKNCTKSAARPSTSDSSGRLERNTSPSAYSSLPMPFELCLARTLLKYYYQKRTAFPVLDQSACSILAPYFPAGNAVRFQYRTYEIRKPKTRNASRFRRLTLVKLLNLITPDPDKSILQLFAESDISTVLV